MFSVGTTPLEATQSNFRDKIRATCVDLDIVEGEFTGDDGVTRITHNLETIWRPDDGGDDQVLRFSLPTNRETGEIATNEDGSYRRPGEKTKWGRFETILMAIGVPAGTDATVLLGLNATIQYVPLYVSGNSEISKEDADKLQKSYEEWQKSGAAGKAPRRAINFSGYYPLEWYGYNNEIRGSWGLEAITTKPVGVMAEAAVVASNGNLSVGEFKALKTLLDSDSFMEYRSTAKADPEMKDFLDRATVDEWIDRGYVVRNQGKYDMGAKWEELEAAVS